MNLELSTELQKIWNTISTDEKAENVTFNVELHKKLLDIFQVGDYYYYILNVRKSVLELIGPEIETVLGYPLEDVNFALVADIVHPEDRPYMLNFEAAIGRFFSHLHGEQLFKYKVQYDYRVRKADGSYARMLMQMFIITHDPENIRTFITHTDITHLKKEPRPILSFIGMDGEPSYINVDVDNLFKPKRHFFTGREREILKALSNGLSSAEIAEKLFISHYTVNSHRKNMLRKASAKTTSELIRLAFDNGWI